MEPTNPNTLIKKVSERTGVPESICKDIINNYWTSVRKGAAEKGSPLIYIRNLGFFKASTNLIEKRITVYENFLKNISLQKNPVFVLKYAAWRISLLKKMQNVYFYDKYIKRKNRKIRISVFRNLQKQEENTGRFNKSVNPEEGD